MAAPSQPKLPSRGAALTIVQNLYGWLINEFDSSPFVQVTAPLTQITQQNGDRVGLLISNFGANDILVSLEQSGAGASFRLVANGGSASFDVRTDFTLTTRAFYAQAVNAAQNVYILEIVAVRPLAPGQFQ